MLNHTYLLVFKIFVSFHLWTLMLVPFTTLNGGIEGVAIGGKLHSSLPLSRHRDTYNLYLSFDSTWNFFFPLLLQTLPSRASYKEELLVEILWKKWGMLSLYKVSRDGYWKIIALSSITIKTFSTHKWNKKLITRSKYRSQLSGPNSNKKNHTMD